MCINAYLKLSSSVNKTYHFTKVTRQLLYICYNKITLHNLAIVDVSVAMRLVKKFNIFLARPWKLSYDELTSTCELLVKN